MENLSCTRSRRLKLAAESATPRDQTISVSIFRYEPGKGSHPRYDRFDVPRLHKITTVLDVLEYVTEVLGSDLAYRSECGIRRCGTCAVRVNGKAKLACLSVIEEPSVVIEPIDKFPVVRDLVTDRSRYERRLREIEPYLVRNEEPREFPEPLRDSDFDEVTRLRRCLECMLCMSVCPTIDSFPKFAGPAVTVQIAKQALDKRDSLDRLPTAVMEGVFSCTQCHDCEEVCPVGIEIVPTIVRLQKDAARRKAVDAAGARARDLKEMTKGYL